MAYYKYYMNAAAAADKIRSGSYKQDTPTRDINLQDTLIRRPQKETPSVPTQKSYQDLAAEYMNLVSYADEIPSFGEGTGGIGSSFVEEGTLPFIPVEFDKSWDSVMKAVKTIESSGGNYEALGPMVTKGQYKGERALGAYQVMPGNLAAWTTAAIGRPVSKEEFLTTPEIQDAVFLDQMKKSYNKYGTIEDAVSVWFSGQPVANSKESSDGYLTTPQYVSKFQKLYNDFLSRGK